MSSLISKGTCKAGGRDKTLQEMSGMASLPVLKEYEMHN